MAKKDSTSCKLSPAVIEQIKAAFEEIAGLALVSKRLSIEATMLCGSDEMLNAIVNSNQVTAEKVGFIADLCSKKLGGGVFIGGATDWFMSPRFNETDSPETAAA